MKDLKVTLNNNLQVIIRNNSNILVNIDSNTEECFLSPSATLAIYCIQYGYTFNELIDYFTNLYDAPKEYIYLKVTSLINKLEKYIHISSLSSDFESNNHDGKVLFNLRHIKCNLHPYGAVKRSFVPKKIVFNITDYCPRECIYCFNGAKCIRKHTIKDEFLSLKRFEEILIEAKQIGVQTIEIGGGDPFVRQDIVDYLSICDAYYPNAWGTSTKAFISKTVAKRLAKLSSVDIQVSLDAFDEAIADTLMGVHGSYKQVLRTFSNLMAEGIIPSAKMVITSLNCHLIKDSFFRFFEMGINTIRANSYMMSPNRHADYLYPSLEQIKIFNNEVDEILDFALRNNINTDISKIEVPMPTQSESEIDERVLCGASSSDMYIRHDGVMTFCGQINNCEPLTVGSLKDCSIMDLWHSKRINELFSPKFLKAKFKDSKCFECTDYYRCYPKRCFVRSYASYGSFFDVDPACPHGIKGYINRG